MNYKIDQAKKHRDERGFLVDFLKLDDIKEGNRKLGQIYFVTFAKKGVVRGNHYHATKGEWFAVLNGKIKAILEDIKTHERRELILDGDSDTYQRIFVGKNIAHAFTSLTKEAAMINYSDKPYYAADPDSAHYLLIEAK
ncbi:MAG: dTDP-4-dehydrorhamnose 3,5-epimerase family protein [Patescibacteria group bacterium]